jgi:hypothetical protein
MTRFQRNPYIALADLVALLAQEHLEAKAHLNEERAHLGLGSAAGDNNNIHGTSNDSIVERHALILADINDRDRRLDNNMLALSDLIRANREEARKARTFRAAHPTPAPATSCNDGQYGKTGRDTWGDQPDQPACHEIAVKAGLCTKHYTRWLRYRQANGIDTTRDYEDATP